MSLQNMIPALNQQSQAIALFCVRFISSVFMCLATSLTSSVDCIVFRVDSLRPVSLFPELTLCVGVITFRVDYPRQFECFQSWLPALVSLFWKKYSMCQIECFQRWLPALVSLFSRILSVLSSLFSEVTLCVCVCVSLIPELTICANVIVLRIDVLRWFHSFQNWQSASVSLFPELTNPTHTH